MRGLIVPEPSEDFSADPVELFFDLAYVLAFSELVGLLLEDPTWDGVGRAALLFTMLWLPWTQFTWSANAVPGNARQVRLLFLIATAASVPMAASVDSALDDAGALFAIPLAVIFLIALAMLVIGVDNASATYRSSLRYGAVAATGMAIIVVGGFVDGDARVVVWLAGVMVFLVSTLRAGRDEWIVRPGHFAERHGLIIIVALGEVIVAVGHSVTVALSEEGSGFPAASIVALVAAGVFAGALWWSYFDRVQPALEHRAEGLGAVERGRFARDIYSFAHLPVVAGIVLAACAVEELTLHPSDPLPIAFGWMAIGGLSLYLGSIVAGAYRAFGVIARERLVAIVAIAAFVLFGADLDGVVMLVAIDVILLAALVVEHLRIEGPTDGRLREATTPDPVKPSPEPPGRS